MGRKKSRKKNKKKELRRKQKSKGIDKNIKAGKKDEPKDEPKKENSKEKIKETKKEAKPTQKRKKPEKKWPRAGGSLAAALAVVALGLLAFHFLVGFPRLAEEVQGILYPADAEEEYIGELKQYLRELEKEIEEEGETPERLRSMGEAYRELARYSGDTAERKEYLQSYTGAYGELVEEDPEDGEKYAELGSAYWQAFKWVDFYMQEDDLAEKYLKNARRSFENAVEYRPEEAAYHRYLGSVYLRLKQDIPDDGEEEIEARKDYLDEALASFRQARELEPDRARSFTNLGHVYRRLACLKNRNGGEGEDNAAGEYLRKAGEKYSRAMQLKPEDVYNYIVLYEINLKLGREEQAEEMASRVHGVVKENIEKAEDPQEQARDRFYWAWLLENYYREPGEAKVQLRWITGHTEKGSRWYMEARNALERLEEVEKPERVTDTVY